MFSIFIKKNIQNYKFIYICSLVGKTIFIFIKHLMTFIAKKINIEKKLRKNTNKK